MIKEAFLVIIYLFSLLTYYFPSSDFKFLYENIHFLWATYTIQKIQIRNCDFSLLFLFCMRRTYLFSNKVHFCNCSGINESLNLNFLSLDDCNVRTFYSFWPIFHSMSFRQKGCCLDVYTINIAFWNRWNVAHYLTSMNLESQN